MQIPIRIPARSAMILLALSLLLSTPAILAQSLKPISLPKPQTTGGKPLLQALAERRTARSFIATPLSQQQLSNLLWAAFGVNRSAEVKAGYGRTAPSAQNKQEVQLYVVLAAGVYTYDAVANTLVPVVEGDVRDKIGSPAQAVAPITIAFVADVKTDRFNGVDTGFIGQNIYLFAASEGLNAWFHAIHGDEAAKALHLSADQHLLYAQAVGFPDATPATPPKP